MRHGCTAVLAACAAVLACAAAPAGAATIVHAPISTSGNWAGYAVAGATFSDVKGSWVQPAVTCPTRQSSYSSLWVGLGGYASSSQGLEQTGTESDCAGGRAVYSAWYELIPAGPVAVPLTISAGDTIDAEVSVSGSTVTLSLTDATTGQTYSTQATLSSNLDVSSAEWIAEAPSQCAGSSLARCSVLPLANFGTVAFSGSSATAGATTGTISNAAWTSQAIALGRSATPSPLDATGDAFTIAYAAPPTVTPSQVTPPGGRAGWGRGWGRGRRHGGW